MSFRPAFVGVVLLSLWWLWRHISSLVPDCYTFGFGQPGSCVSDAGPIADMTDGWQAPLGIHRFADHLRDHRSIRSRCP
uniref:Putative secreted peptide n=1 Tax=Anopheles braziliensis TaxID=58242 RepID=A0A2M3ZTK3_9DIPT